VIVKKISDVIWCGGSEGGSAEDGLGDSQQMIMVCEDGLHVGESKGTHYDQMAGGATVTVNVTPSITLNAGSVGWLRLSVPSVTPVELDFSGTTLDTSGNQNILIGQQLTASIPVPDGATVANCSWGGDNCNPIADYSTNGLGSTPWAPNESLSSTSFYITDGGAPGSSLQSNFGCIAHFNLPAGALPADGLDVSAYKNINIYTPFYSLVPTVGLLYTYLNPSSATSGFVELEQHITNPPSGESSGMSWKNTFVLTPGAFTQSNTAYGKFSMFQFDSPTDSHTYTPTPVSGGTPVEYDIAGTDINQPNTLINVNGKFAVDCRIPYAGLTFDANGNFQDSADSPSDSFPQSAFNSSGIATKETSVSRSDNFTDYLMYMPPSVNGAGTIWVSLAAFTWGYSYSLSANSSGVWTENKATNPTQPSVQAVSCYPEWGYVVGSSNYTLTFIDSNGDTAK
jgi:hypothetical protein